MTTSDAPIRLYELVLADGRSASPYVWRIRYALAHKGLQFESVPLGFTDIPGAFAGRFKTVPVLEHGLTMLAESWDIAEYLDRTYPDRAPLFATPTELAAARFIDSWFAVEVVRRLIRVYILDVHAAARPADQAYFRLSREARFGGATLEAVTAERIALLPEVRAALQPIRLHLGKFPFLGGQAPSYADYIAFGSFQWVASVSSLPLLARDDSLIRGWLDRGFDLYDGIGRDPRQRALFE